MAIRGNFTDLGVVTCIAEMILSGQPLEFWCRDRTLGEGNLRSFKFDFVTFYAVAEPFPRGALVFVETLSIRRKLTADHALFSVIFGHHGANATYLCWACEATNIPPN